MQVTADISFYPLSNNYLKIVEEFLHSLYEVRTFTLETTDTSTLITGEYSAVMQFLENQLKPFLESGDAVFVIKLSNACGQN